MHKDPAIILSQAPEIHVVLGLVRDALARAGLTKFSADQNTLDSILVIGPFSGFTITEDSWQAKSLYFATHQSLLPENTLPDHFLPSLSLTIPATPGAQWAHSLVLHYLAFSLKGVIATPTQAGTYSLAKPDPAAVASYDRWIQATYKPGIAAKILRTLFRSAKPTQVLR